MKIDRSNAVPADLKPSADFKRIVPKRPARIAVLTDDDTRETGVRCPKCNCRHCPKKTTRHFKTVTRYGRECRHCGHHFWTREYIEANG